jgi:hypothetical protein
LIHFWVSSEYAALMATTTTAGGAPSGGTTAGGLATLGAGILVIFLLSEVPILALSGVFDTSAGTGATRPPTPGPAAGSPAADGRGDPGRGLDLPRDLLQAPAPVVARGTAGHPVRVDPVECLQDRDIQDHP